MLGEIFRVYEIDEYGSAWVETPLTPHANGYTFGHSIALDAQEMQVASRQPRRRPTRG
jgi:hypothetical protein